MREEYGRWGKTHGHITDTDRAVAEYRCNDPRPEFANFGPAGKALLGEGLIEGDEPFPKEQCMPHRIAEESVQFVEQYADQPFFLHLSFPDPHWPNTVCEPCYSMYDPSDLPPLEAYPMEWHGNPFKYFVQAIACGYDKYTKEERKRILAAYYGQVTFIDNAVGTLLQRLDEMGLTDNTLVLFTSDHGNFAGRYGLVGKTGGFMDALMRIPLIIRGPAIRQGRSPAMVSNIDVLPTLFEAVAMPVPEAVQGRSFA